MMMMVGFSFFPEQGWAYVSPHCKHSEQLLHPTAFQSHVNTLAQRFPVKIREMMEFKVNECKLSLLWTWCFGHLLDQAHASARRKELLFSWLLYMPDLDISMSGNKKLTSPFLFFFLCVVPSPFF